MISVPYLYDSKETIIIVYCFEFTILQISVGDLISQGWGTWFH